VSLAPTVQLEAGDPVPARRGRHLLWPAIALGHNRQLCFIAEPATTARVDHIQAADRLTIPDNVHGYNTVHIDVDIASALPNASIPQGGPARMRTIDMNGLASGPSAMEATMPFLFSSQNGTGSQP
jgi:hypothetical protein